MKDYTDYLSPGGTTFWLKNSIPSCLSPVGTTLLFCDKDPTEPSLRDGITCVLTNVTKKSFRWNGIHGGTQHRSLS